MSAARNTPPANVWEALRRLLNCNKAQLAAHLGVTPKTLARWEAEGAGKNGHEKAATLLQKTLDEAECLPLAQWVINWPAIRTIGGKR